VAQGVSLHCLGSGCLRLSYSLESNLSYSRCGPIQNQTIASSFMTPKARQSRSILTA